MVYENFALHKFKQSWLTYLMSYLILFKCFNKNLAVCNMMAYHKTETKSAFQK